MKHTVEVKLPQRFYDDHKSRDLPSGTEIKRTKHHVYVALDPEAYDDLVSDAEYYTDPSVVGQLIREEMGIVSSARATLKILRATERPPEGDYDPTATVTVDAPARAWEGAELWTSYPPLKSEKLRMGRGHTYRITLDRGVAYDLLDYCEIAFQPSWCGDQTEVESIKRLAARLLRAFGLTYTVQAWFRMPSESRERLATGQES